MRIALAMVILAFAPFLAHSATIEVPKDYVTIQAAIDASINGDTILVAPGIYFETIDFLGKAITLTSESGAGVTEINGNQSGRVVSFQNKEGLDSILNGFTITNGEASGNKMGGGVYCYWESSPTIMCNIISGNNAELRGGGISCLTNSSPVIMNNVISNNTASYGAGVFCDNNSSPTIANNHIKGNATLGAWGNGGGIYCLNFSSPTIINNTIEGNTASYLGGGIRCTFGSSPIITNNIIIGNAASGTDGTGAGIYCYKDSTPLISSNTIWNNSAALRGGGIYCLRNSAPIVVNTILWDNTAPTGPELLIGNASSPSILSISYSDVKGGKNSVHLEPGSTLNWGPGMVDADPLFADPINNDSHLTFTSPCKDTGDTSAVTELYDFEGDPRIVNGAVDMGADEFHTHLYYTGNAFPGSNINLRFVDAPSTSPVVLWLGSGVLQNPMNLPPYGDWHLQFPILLQAQLGSIPGPDGVLSLPCTIPGNLPPIDLPLQAGIGIKLTNLLELKIL